MDNLYNPATDANEVQAFNKKVSFCESAKDITGDEIAAASARLELLKQTLKETIAND